MPIGVPNPFWQKAKNRNAFMRLCKAAEKPSVNWKKFHKLDEEGIFEGLSIGILSAQFRKIRLRRKGLCWSCGKRKSKDQGGLCSTCRTNMKKTREENRKDKENAE